MWFIQEQSIFKITLARFCPELAAACAWDTMRMSVIKGPEGRRGKKWGFNFAQILKEFLYYFCKFKDFISLCRPNYLWAADVWGTSVFWLIKERNPSNGRHLSSSLSRTSCRDSTPASMASETDKLPCHPWAIPIYRVCDIAGGSTTAEFHENRARWLVFELSQTCSTSIPA